MRCVQSLYSVSVFLSSAGCPALCTPSATRLVVQLARSSKIRSSFFTHAVWLSNGSSADKRCRIDLKRVQPIRSLLPYPALETSRASEFVLMGLEHSRSPRAKTSIKIKSTTKPRACIFPTDRAAHKHVFGLN